MTQRRINRSDAFVIAFGLILSFPTSAHAETFVIPPQLQHDGLAFSPSTTFDKQISIPTNTATVQFVDAPNALEISKPHQQTQDLEKIVITPPVQPTEPSEAPTQAIIPTPTIYIAPAVEQDTPPLPSPTPKVTTKLYTPTPIATTTITPTTPPITVTQAVIAGGLNADKLFGMVNSYRQTKGLPAFEKDDRECTLATSRAPEINGEIAAGTMHSGLRARALPYWNTENIISMNSEVAAFNWWINDTIHREAIESSNKYSCVACSGNACAEEFTSFQPK